MPTTYAHDVFGKEVYRRLPEEMRRCIQKNRKLYLIGLHGPDILFYYHPFKKNEINELGGQLHKKSARSFFEECKRRSGGKLTEEMTAYLLGFGCHFLLDSACHPYINEYEWTVGISHAEIETHMDRVLLMRDGKDPFRYLPACAICTGSEIERVIAGAFSAVTKEQIHTALKGMKRFTSLPVCRFAVTRGLLLAGLRLVGCYDSMEGQIMRKKQIPNVARQRGSC